MAERVLTVRELNRALLARQLLLERKALPLPRAVEQMGCVQAQYAPSTYVGLWSRVESLERDAVTRALARRSLVQGTLMRNTIHVVSRADYWPLVIAVRAERMAWSRSVQRTDARAVRRAAKPSAFPRRRAAAPEGDRGRRALGSGRRHLARPRARAAVRHLGAATR
jgi:hypothetical protein